MTITAPNTDTFDAHAEKHSDTDAYEGAWKKLVEAGTVTEHDYLWLNWVDYYLAERAGGWGLRDESCPNNAVVGVFVNPVHTEGKGWKWEWKRYTVDATRRDLPGGESWDFSEVVTLDSDEEVLDRIDRFVAERIAVAMGSQA